jgi:hypothetical protein
VIFTYLKQPPKRYTFEMPKLKKWVEQQCRGKVLNLFAGKTLLKVDEVRNDIDVSMPAEYHMHAEDMLRFLIDRNRKFDTVILDPPYNLRKSREKYNGKNIGSFTLIKRLVLKVLNPHGRVITLGYSSVGYPTRFCFEKTAICLVCHSGNHNDTICLVEQRMALRLLEMEK